MKKVTILALVVAPAIAALPSGCLAPNQATYSKSHNPAPASSEISTTSPTPVALPPTSVDLFVGVIITEQKCFGSAGCNYRYAISLRYISAKPLPEKTTAIFTVSGGEQDQVSNFTIAADGTATFDREASISGEDNASLKANVTQAIPGR